MVDKVEKIFEDTIRKALRTERQQGFRLCIDEKDDISLAEVGIFVPPRCPSGTKKTLDILITP